MNAMSRFRIDASPLSALTLPDFSGSMLRGALGHALAHVNSEAYGTYFATGAGHAFIITPPFPGKLAAGEIFSFFVTLLHSEADAQEYFFNALELALRKGLGPLQVPCQMLACTWQPDELSRLGARFRLELVSPWFVKLQSEPVMAHQFGLDNLLIAATHRQRQLVKRGYLIAELPTNQQLLDCVQAASYQQQLRNVIGERRSQRQKTKHRLQGVIGHMDIELQSQQYLHMIAPVLHRARWLHGGSKVSFGLGALEIKSLGSLDSQLKQLHHLATGAAL